MNKYGPVLEKKILIAALFVPAMFLFPIHQAFAQGEVPVEAVWIIEGEAFTVGDPIALTLAVTHPADHQVILPELQGDWGDFTVESAGPLSSALRDDGSETTLQTFDVRLFAPGDFTTPTLTIQVTDGQGALIDVPVAPINVSIASVLVEGDQTLRDIKPQADIPIAAPWLWLTSGALLLLTLVGFASWVRKRRSGVAVLVDPRSPHEIALDELERIEEASLHVQGAFKEHYALVADCLRLYLEGEFRIETLDRTTAEIGRELIKVDLSSVTSRRYVALLHECDLVKFSKYTPDLNAASLIVTQARQLIELTQTRAVSAPANSAKTDQGPNAQNRQQWEGVS